MQCIDWVKFCYCTSIFFLFLMSSFTSMFNNSVWKNKSECASKCVWLLMWEWINFRLFGSIRQRADCGQLHLFNVCVWTCVNMRLSVSVWIMRVLVCVVALRAMLADRCCCYSIPVNEGHNPHIHYHIHTAPKIDWLCVSVCVCLYVWLQLA